MISALGEGAAGNAALIIVVAIAFGAFEWILSHGPPARFIGSWFSKDRDNAARCRSSVHQTVLRTLGLVHLLVQLPTAVAVLRDPAMQKDRLYSQSQRSAFMLCFSAGYFLHDLYTCMTQLSEWGLSYLVHALVCFTIYGYGAIVGHLQYYGAMFLLWEASTPFVYVRWFLHKLGKSHTRAYIVNGLLMVLTFFLTRNVFGIVMSVDYFRQTTAELASPRPGGLSKTVIWIYRAANLCLNTLNVFWFQKMVSGAAKLLRKPKSKST